MPPTADTRAPKRRLSVRRRLAFALALAGIAFLLAFAVAEIAVRRTRAHEDLLALTGRRPGENPMKEWAYVDAFCAFRAQPGTYPGRHSGTKTVNRHGFVSTPDLEHEKTDGELRIAFLGGSSTAGTGMTLPDEETWPWKVVELLRTRLAPREITFINAAVGGYTSFESYGRLWSRLRFFEPDVVVVYHGWNDMYYFADPNRVRDWRTYGDGEWGFAHSDAQVMEPFVLDPLIQYSQVLTKIRRKLVVPDLGEVGRIDGGELATGYDAEALEIWRTNLRLMQAACELMGAELFACKQATLIVPGLAAEDRERCGYALHGFDHDAHVDAFAAVHRVVEEEVPASHVIDTSVVSGRAEYFFDHVHPTPQGTTEIAEIVADALVAGTFLDSGVSDADERD